MTTTLREFEKIEMNRCYDGIYRLDHAVIKKQNEILSAFGISCDDVKFDAKETVRIMTIYKRDRSKELSNGKNKEQCFT